MKGTQLAIDADKLEVQKQWDKDPCGSETISSVPFGSLEYFRAMRDHRYKVYAPWLLKAIPFGTTRNKDVLEIGVGLGSDHYNFASNGNKMTMLDLSRTHFECTQKHMELEGLKSKPVYGDAEDMPFESQSFDVVYSFGVLHHTPIEKAISEVYRVLKPGGEAWIGLYYTKSWFFLIQTCLVNGLIKGNFFRKGWRKTLSMIEYRKDEDSAVPLVHVYTRNQCIKWFQRFKDVKVSTYHVDASHFYRLGNLLGPFIPREWLEKYLSFGGWYLIIHCKK